MLAVKGWCLWQSLQTVLLLLLISHRFGRHRIEILLSKFQILYMIARGYKIADQIDTGGMIVNPAYVYRTFDMPFGGHKQSGIGNEGFFNTMEEMTQLKSIVLTGIKG